MEKHLLYISDVPPKAGFGASVIIYRHLKRLKGWKITILVPEQPIKEEYAIPESWQVVMFPEKIWWWPPVKYMVPGSLELRNHLLKLECLKILRGTRPSVVLNVFGRLSMLAFYLSQSLKAPLTLHIQDRWELWVRSGIEAKCMQKGWEDTILDHASRLWALSPGIAEYYNTDSRRDRMSVLYASSHGNPEGYAEWKDDFRANPVIVSSGTFHEHHVPIFKSVARALTKINGTLMMMGTHNGRAAERLKGLSNIMYKESIIDNRELIKFLKEKAACILVPGTFGSPNDYNWKINIPSRLVEFSHLGMPMIIASQPDAVLSRWARERNWLAYLDSLDDNKTFNIVKQLIEKERWLAMAEQSKNAAEGDFNTERIQAQFEAELAAP